MVPQLQNNPYSDAPRVCRWLVGVPVLTNPLMLMNVVVALAGVWGLAAVFILFVQWTAGGGVTPSVVEGAVIMGAWLALYGLGAFVLGAVVLFRNAYAVLYRMDDRGLTIVTMRGHIRPLHPALLRWRAYAVHELTNPARSVEKRVDWAEVCAVRCMDAMRLVTLLGERGCLVRVHCPDAALFDAVRARAEQSVAELKR